MKFFVTLYAGAEFQNLRDICHKCNSIGIVQLLVQFKKYLFDYEHILGFNKPFEESSRFLPFHPTCRGIDNKGARVLSSTLAETLVSSLSIF